MSNTEIKIDLKELMVLSSYLALKNFDNENLSFSEEQGVAPKIANMIDSVTEKFNEDFSKNLKQLLIREVEKHQN